MIINGGIQVDGVDGLVNVVGGPEGEGSGLLTRRPRPRRRACLCVFENEGELHFLSHLWFFLAPMSFGDLRCEMFMWH